MLLVNLCEAFTRLEWKKGSRVFQMAVLEHIHERLPFIVPNNHIDGCELYSNVTSKNFTFRIVGDAIYEGTDEQNKQLSELLGSEQFTVFCKNLIEDMYQDVGTVGVTKTEYGRRYGTESYYTFSVKCKLLKEDVQISAGVIKQHIATGLRKGNIIADYLKSFMYNDSAHIGSVTVFVIGSDFSPFSPNVIGNQLENLLHKICDSAGVDFVDYKGLGVDDTLVNFRRVKCTVVRIKFDANRLVKQLSGK